MECEINDLEFYYVYSHTRPDTNEIFYVGKGVWTKHHKFQRAYTSDNRNVFWRRIVQKCDGCFEVNIAAAWDDHTKCVMTEQALIATYGRRDLKTGTLCNLTDGGEGHLGIVTSEALREKRSKLFSGENHPNWGKKLSAETCRRKSEAISGDKHFLKGKTLPDSWKENIADAKRGCLNPQFGKHSPVSRRVINTLTGADYPSTVVAAKSEGFVYQTLYNMLSGFRKNHTALRFADAN